MPYEIDPNYDSLDRLDKWDAATREVIKQRLAREIGAISVFNFLDRAEGQTLEIITAVLVPQAAKEAQVKIAQAIDRGLNDQKEGVRYGENPWRGDLYRQGLAEIRKDAEKIFGKSIESLDENELNGYVDRVMQRTASDFSYRFLKKVLADSIVVYFSHPAAWNRIGFPGPAYPEGYAYLDCQEKETWEPDYRKKI